MPLAYLLFFGVILALWQHYVQWPRMRARLRSGASGARVRMYRDVIVRQWIVAGAAFVLWWRSGASVAAIGLALPEGWRLGIALAAIALISVMLALQARTIARLDAAGRAAVGARLGAVTDVLPRMRDEVRWFAALAVTAGVCEEFLYRGFALWALSPLVGVVGAAGASTAAFGLGHAYQGRAGCVRSTLTGAAMMAVALATHSIVPGVVLHTVIDLAGGAAGYALLGRSVEPTST